MKIFTNASFKFVRFGAIGFAVAILFISLASSAFASTATASIQSLSPGNTVQVGTPVTFTVDAVGFTAPTYTLTDAFVDGSLGKYDLTNAGAFSWTPARNDIGTHNITILIYDENGNTQTLQLTLTVTASGSSTSSTSSTSSSSSSASTAAPATVSIQSIAPSTTVTSGQAVSFDVTSAGFTSTPSYSVSDSYNSSSVSTSDINSLGEFFWTPDANDIGSHVLTVIASDSSGQTAQGTVTLTVQAPAASISSTDSAANTAATSVPVDTTTDTSTGTTSASVAPTAATFTENLTVGSNDSQVTALQQLLIAQGDMTGTATGYYGTLTEAAVKKFQTAHSISALGIVGPSTRAALNALLASRATSASVTATADASTSDTTAASTSTTSSAPTIAQIQSEVQALTTQLGLIESQLSQLSGQ